MKLKHYYAAYTQCGLSAELFSKKTKLRQVRFIRRAAYLPENTVYNLVLAMTGSQTKH